MNKRKNNTSPLKIAVLGHKTIPSRQGGIEIVVEELTVRMAKLGHKITVYNRSGHHVSGKEFDGKKLKEYKGIRMKYVPTIDKKGLAAMSASFFAAVQQRLENMMWYIFMQKGRVQCYGCQNYSESDV